MSRPTCPERSPSLARAVSITVVGVACAAAVTAWFLGWTGERWGLPW